MTDNSMNNETKKENREDKVVIKVTEGAVLTGLIASGLVSTMLPVVLGVGVACVVADFLDDLVVEEK